MNNYIYLWYLSCPAVSHISNFILLPETLIVFVKKAAKDQLSISIEKENRK